MAVAGGVFIFSCIWWWGTAKKGSYLRENRVCAFLLGALAYSIALVSEFQVAMRFVLEAMSLLSSHCGTRRHRLCLVQSAGTLKLCFCHAKTCTQVALGCCVRNNCSFVDLTSKLLMSQILWHVWHDKILI